MNAYEFYLSTCKYVLFADPATKSTWADLYGYLPCLRQMLSCCVCGNIMLKPKGPGHGICSHHVCATCIGGKMRLRPACSWCRTHEGFVDSPGMRILVLCFKRMCEYISSCPIGAEIRKAATNGAHTNTLIKILDEAAAFEDDYEISNKVMPTCVPTYGMAPEPKLVSLPRGPTSTAGPGKGAKGGRARSDSNVSTNSQNDKDTPPRISTADASSKPPAKDKIPSTNGPLKLKGIEDELEKMPALLAPCTRAMDSHEKLSPPLAGPPRADALDQQSGSTWPQPPRSGRGEKPGPEVRKRATGNGMMKKGKPGRGAVQPKLRKSSLVHQAQLKIKGRYQKKQKKVFKQEIDFEPPCKRTRLASSMHNSGSVPEHKICKCARLNAPSRLTCFGQRCPCYSSRLPCINCMCRGCRNPRKEPSLLRHGDDDKSDAEHDPPMPRLSPEPRT